MARKTEAVERDISDYSKKRRKYSKLKGSTGKTKKEIEKNLNARKLEQQDAMIREINQTHPSGNEITDQPTNDIDDKFDSFIWRKAA